MLARCTATSYTPFAVLPTQARDVNTILLWGQHHKSGVYWKRSWLFNQGINRTLMWQASVLVMTPMTMMGMLRSHNKWGIIANGCGSHIEMAVIFLFGFNTTWGVWYGVPLSATESVESNKIKKTAMKRTTVDSWIKGGCVSEELF